MAQWNSSERSGKKGRPPLYSKEAILCALMIKYVFHIGMCVETHQILVIAMTNNDISDESIMPDLLDLNEKRGYSLHR